MVLNNLHYRVFSAVYLDYIFYLHRTPIWSQLLRYPQNSSLIERGDVCPLVIISVILFALSNWFLETFYLGLTSIAHITLFVIILLLLDIKTLRIQNMT